MEKLLELLMKIEEGTAEVPSVPPQTIHLHDTAMACYIVDMYQGRGVRDSQVRPGNILEWFTNTPQDEVVYHLWNAWHRKS